MKMEKITRGTRAARRTDVPRGVHARATQKFWEKLKTPV